MEERNTPCPGEFYRHFKNKLYQIVAVAEHSESGEELVIYQALYGEFKVYARPLPMFMSAVDRQKYPDTVQKYRFQKVVLEKVEEESLHWETQSSAVRVLEAPKENTREAEPMGLMDFLDAATYTEKLNILKGMRRNIDEKMIFDMAVSLDVVLKEEPLEDKIKDLESCLKTLARFECNRLR